MDNNNKPITVGPSTVYLPGIHKPSHPMRKLSARQVKRMNGGK